MSETVEGLGGSERERIASLREQGRFFWIDLSAGAVAGSQLSGRITATTYGQGRRTIVVPRYKGILRAFPLHCLGS
jgi:hypothetical protein